MTLEEYDTIVKQVAELVDKDKNYPAAVELLQKLVESDLPDIDRSMMSINMATVCELMGHDAHAIQWFDHAIALERPYRRWFAANHKASFLMRKGRKDEAAAIYQSLIPEPFLTIGERTSLENHLRALAAPPAA
jgi:hypothetical protein